MTEPSVEWALPFLWYWRAVRQGDRWVYLDSAGRDSELARVRAEGPDDYYVEVQAMALRHYLHVRGMALLLAVQVDQDHPTLDSVAREHHALENDWASMEFQIYDYEADLADGRFIAATSLHGQYVVRPAENAPGPAWCTDETPTTYPDFIYGIDASSGKPLTVQPTRANAGIDGSPGPHFWTRVYFDAQVLNRYLSEPRRYTVTANLIQCLHIWTLSIGRTSDGLIEVDIYDLSRMPWLEWSHWKAHNVPPSGGEPDEGKLRRERLNQVASGPDIVRELRAAVKKANEAAQQHAGWPLWRPLEEPTATEWDTLHPPVVNDRSALQGPLLTLCKVLADSLDAKRIKKALVAEVAKDTKSLALLQQYIDELGGPANAVGPLRDLQTLRSQGGFAHYAGGSTEKALDRLVNGLRNTSEIFEYICHNLIEMLDSITATIVAASASPAEESSGRSV
ncbi:hypothetical protein E1264_12075 [Actinomadura sp. KC216]|uniref:hypothetical protein n=1 Tax=Actinomadura sp. KC216 TaxID=2530370 RepID=UPI00104620AB|nr:hypothetical protein [Actinomadura sp. KC216]TDB88222.1 hypothetical protein E1264_12075 [Actinomadura sp. KC216]